MNEALKLAQEIAVDDGNVWDDLHQWQRDLYVKSSEGAIRLMKRNGEWRGGGAA